MNKKLLEQYLIKLYMNQLMRDQMNISGIGRAGIGPTGFYPAIPQIALPEGLEGPTDDLSMFRRRTYSDNPRMFNFGPSRFRQ